MKNPFKPHQSPEDKISREDLRLQRIAEETGRAAGKIGAPKEAQSIEPYIGKLRAGYQQMVAMHVTALVANASEEHSQFQQTTMNEKRERLKNQLNDFTERLRTATLMKDELPTDGDNSKKIGLHVAILVLACFESIVNTRAYHLYSAGSNWMQVIIFVGLCVVFYFLPSALVQIYRKTEDMPTKWIWRIAVLALVFGTFLLFGMFRQTYVTQIGATTLKEVKTATSYELKPWYFAVINLFFLLISSYLSMQIPEREQRKRADTRDDAERKVAGLEKRISQIEEELDSLPDALANKESSRQRTIATAKTNAERISAMFQAAVNQYKETNLTWRNTPAPSSFSDPVPDLAIPRL